MTVVPTICMCIMYISRALGGQKRGSESLDLELQVFGNDYVGVGTRI